MDNSFEKFEEKYQPIAKPEDESSLIFDTHDESDQEFVKKHISSNLVWTLIEGEDNLYIIPGYHFVNRLGYVICKIPYEEGCEEEYEY